MVILDTRPAVPSTQKSDDDAPRAPAQSWTRVVLLVATRAYLAFVATLVATALVPNLVQWESFVVRSGSMEPSISVGDVVVASPMGATEAPDLGRVFIFRAPAGDGTLLVHRVVGHRPQDDSWVTQGDANADRDAARSPTGAFVARARILVPFVGKPVLWWEQGRIVPLVAFLVISAAALVVSVTLRPPRGPRGPRRGAPVAGLASAVTLAVALGASGGVDQASGAFTSTTRNSGDTWTASAALVLPYNRVVLADSPYAYYLLDEAGGTIAQDFSGNGRTGTYTSVSGYRAPGALPNNFGYAVDLGGTARVVGGGASWMDPRTFSVELWFRTSSTSGGKLVGFESSQAASSTSYDRHVTLRPDGRLVYGDWAGSPYRTVVTPAAYNDGSWHHLVVTSTPNSQQLEQATIYVDGQAVTSGAVTKTAQYAGWWRIGYGRTLTGSSGFPGRVDQFAVYASVLPAARVQAHYLAR